MIDFPAIAEEYGIPLITEGHHHCVAGWAQTHCPTCSHGDGWHLGWNLSKGYFSCWRCGKRKTSDVLRALVPTVAVGELYRRFIVGKKAPSVAVARRKGRARAVVYPPDIGPLRTRQRSYLKKRGFDPDLIQEIWGVRGVGPCGGIWAHRILIPIHDQDGQVVSFTGRAIADVEPKYLNLSVEKSVENPKSILYGIHLVQHDHVIVVEGPMDAWRLGPGAVALMGAVWTTDQVEGLRRFKRISLIPDNDDAGRRCMERLAAWLRSADSKIEIIYGLESDPGDLSSAEVDELRGLLEWKQ